MSWETVLQVALLMFWAALLASPWSPRARRRIQDEQARAWKEVNQNVRK